MLVGDPVHRTHLRSRVGDRDRNDGEAEADRDCLGKPDRRTTTYSDQTVGLGGDRLPARRLRQLPRHMLSSLVETASNDRTKDARDPAPQSMLTSPMR